MPATACCSLSRSPPDLWPGHYSFTFYLLLFFILLHEYSTLYIKCFAAIGLNKIVLIPDSNLQNGRQGRMRQLSPYIRLVWY